MMHFRRLVTFLLGAWLLGSLFMTVVATQNFRSVDRLLQTPPLAAKPMLEPLGDNARLLLRYQASELNRRYFASWEWVQLGLALAVAVLLVYKAGSGTLAVLLSFGMLAIVALMRFYLTPAMEEVGRLIDFLPPGLETPQRVSFRRFHNAYSALELLKWALAVTLSARLLRSRRGSRSAVRQTPWPAAVPADRLPG